ncbi:Cullin-4A [Fonsecaea pedrosoi]|nr:Cullin-4A [Fonsecaea pedrosoi]
MTTPRKGKAPDRGTASQPRFHSSPKRPAAAGEGSPSARASKRHRISVPDLLSPQRSSNANRRTRGEYFEGEGNMEVDNKMQSSGARHPKDAFASMYEFNSTRLKKDHLNDSSPVPENGRTKPAFANQRVPFNPQTGPKKLVVKNLRAATRLDTRAYFEKTWKENDKALDAIFKNEKDPYSLEELYKGAEHTCRHGHSADLYEHLSTKCETHLNGNVRDRIRREESNSSDVDVLRALVNAWQTWQKQLQTVRQIFFYMDQTYCLRTPDKMSVLQMGLSKFRSSVFYDPFIRQKSLQGIIALIESDRRGNLIETDARLLRQAVDTFHQLSIYTSDLEPTLCATTEEYFKAWRDTESNKDSLGDYVNNCTALLAREMARCDSLSLDRNTRIRVSRLFDTILVEEELETLTNEDGILDLLEDDKSAELERLYTLLQRKGHGELIAPSFSKYVETEGSLIVFDEQRESEMVIRLLDFKRRLDHYHKYSFHGNEALGNALHKAFETFINKTKKSQSNWDTDNAKPGEMIAKHVDLLLKGGVKAVPRLQTHKQDPSKPEEEHDFDDGAADEDAEINQHLSDALDLFRFVHGKAVFEAFYKKDLARRLLLGRSASFDAERNMLTRLKNECGAAFTHNLESMFKDMDLAREEMMSYNQLMDDRGGRAPGLPDLHVNVLSAAAWPTYPDVAVNIPPHIAKVMSDFETHYKAKHSGRKLTWKHSLAHCQLRAKFPKGNKELMVSGFQAVVLLLFNDIPADKHLTYNEIKAASGLVDAELKRTLQSLACAKYQVLRKHPKGRDVNETDTFTFSQSFTDQKLRIKINQIQLKETKEENKETHIRVAADRHYETQAAIVRIMKSRKKIGHNELIVEVIKATMTRGVLDQADIKRNIEKLIEKDYMEREEGNTYSYVA